jgi:hypothetical protein
MSTTQPTAPPPLPPAARPRTPRRPGLTVPLEAAGAADGSRCVTRDPETSRPDLNPLPIRPMPRRRHGPSRPPIGWRHGGPFPVRSVLAFAIASLPTTRSTP